MGVCCGKTRGPAPGQLHSLDSELDDACRGVAMVELPGITVW